MRVQSCTAMILSACELQQRMNPEVRPHQSPDLLSTKLTAEQVIIAPPELHVVVDPRQWFDASAPLELEIGCGKGGFLLARAQSHPQIHFLGIEWANKFFRFAADRMARWNVQNVRLMRTDARLLVMQHLAANCLSALHLYHPDPWPKKRHHKRRLVQPDFAEAAARCLQNGAWWYIQSDHQEYFEEMKALLDVHPQFSAGVDSAVAEAFGPRWAGTNYETKYRREGREIFRAIYQRRTDPHR